MPQLSNKLVKADKPAPKPKVEKVPKAPKLQKEVKTIAEKSGIASVKEVTAKLDQILEATKQATEKPVVEKKPRKKREYTEEQKAVLRERLALAREKKKELQASKTTGPPPPKPVPHSQIAASLSANGRD